MIVYFLLIILASTVSGDDDDNSDTEYIKTLPASVKKDLLDKVAGRLLEFGYASTQNEKNKKFSSIATYLYNNAVSSRTEEIFENGGDGKKYLMVNDDDKYIERDDASEDDSNTGEDTKDKKQIEVVVLDMNENKATELRQGAYFSSRYKWDEEGNRFTNERKVFDIQHAVSYSPEKAIAMNQREESNKVYDRIKKLVRPIVSADNNSVEVVTMAPEDVKKTLDFFKNLDTNNTVFNKKSLSEMVKGIESFADSAKAAAAAAPPSIPGYPRPSRYLKQRLTNLRHQTNETQNNSKPILRTSSCNKPKKCIRGLKANNSSKFKTPNNKLDSINKITQITPEVDMLQNVESMLKINGFPIARRNREDDLDLYVRILKNMVKMDIGALEEYI